jgi:hypothetical protein
MFSPSIWDTDVGINLLNKTHTTKTTTITITTTATTLTTTTYSEIPGCSCCKVQPMYLEC